MLLRKTRQFAISSFVAGEDGQANIIIDLTDGTVPIDVRRTALGVSVEMRDVELPERLQNRRNVNDFATPVSSITFKGCRQMSSWTSRLAGAGSIRLIWPTIS
jgi:hypothetical protein